MLSFVVGRSILPETARMDRQCRPVAKLRPLTTVASGQDRDHCSCRAGRAPWWEGGLLAARRGNRGSAYGVGRAQAMAYRDARGAGITGQDWSNIEAQLREAYRQLKLAIVPPR
jgi:hypothetical protein